MNALALNDDGVLVSCGDDGSMKFWDSDSGYCFQSSKTIVQPGSLEAESGIYAAMFDHSGRYFLHLILKYIFLNFLLKYH